MVARGRPSKRVGCVMADDRERAVARAIHESRFPGVHVSDSDLGGDTFICDNLTVADLLAGLDALRAYDEAHASERVPKEGKVT